MVTSTSANDGWWVYNGLAIVSRVLFGNQWYQREPATKVRAAAAEAFCAQSAAAAAVNAAPLAGTPAQGIFSSVAGSSVRYAWSYLPSRTKVAVVGIGVLTLAYLARRYRTGSGAYTTNNFSPTVHTTFNLSLVGILPGTRIDQRQGKDGSYEVTVTQPRLKFVDVTRAVIEKMRIQNSVE